MLRSLILAVLFTIAASAQVTISSPIVVFTYSAGTTVAPSSQLDTLTAASGSTINLTSVNVTYGAGATNWLSVAPTIGALPMALSLQVTNPSLPAGSYSVVLQAAFDTAPSTQITVFLVVTAIPSGGGGGSGPPSLTISPSSLSFSYQPGSTAPVPQALSVVTSDNSAYSTTVTTTDGNPWLSFFPSSGATPASPIASANPAGLTPGIYYGSIYFSSSSGGVGLVSVTFTISSATLVPSPASLTFNVPSGFGLSAYQPIQVGAAVPTTFNASTNDSNGDWLQTDTSSAKTPATVNVRVNTAALAPGAYQGTVTLQADPSDAVTIPITLNVGQPATLTLLPTTLNFSYTTGNAAPAAQTVAITSATSTPNQNVSIVATTTDGGNWLSSSLSTATTPANIAVSVNPAGFPAGSYLGNIAITPSAQGSSPQNVTVNLTITGSGRPVVAAVVNGASYAGGAVSPGEIVALFGSGLGPKTLATFSLTTNGTVPTALASTQVTFDGIPAPILYAWGGQTGVQVPYGIGSTVTSLSIAYEGITPTAPLSLPVAASAPGIFTVAAGQAAAINQDGTVNSAANPAVRGSTISLFVTGGGQTNPASVEGAITPINGPYPQPQQAVAVKIGGQVTQIAFEGEAPASITGLLQLNVQVPTSISSGANAVQVQIGPAFSPSGVTVFVK